MPASTAAAGNGCQARPAPGSRTRGSAGQAGRSVVVSQTWPPAHGWRPPPGTARPNRSGRRRRTSLGAPLTSSIASYRPRPGGPAGMDDYVEQVLRAVESIPRPGLRVLRHRRADRPGRPRQVGQVMSAHGAAVPWWRVVRADGRPARGLEEEALSGCARRGHHCAGPGGPARARFDFAGHDHPLATRRDASPPWVPIRSFYDRLGTLLQVVCVVVRATPPELCVGVRKTWRPTAVGAVRCGSECRC